MKGARRVFRRIMALAAALMALAALACAETLCLVAPEIVALTDGEGNVLLGGDDIEEVFTVRAGALYAAGARGDYRLYDAEGKPLGQTRFSMIDDAGDCLIYRSGGLFGAMDASGNGLLPAAWTQLVPNGEGGLLALDGDPLDDRPDGIICIDPDGEALPTGVSTASGLSRVLHGRMPYMDPEGRYGATDARGKAVIRPVWRAMSPFEGGVAKVYGDGGAGLIDRDGRELLPPVHRWLERSAALLAAAREDRVEVYGPDGRQRLFAVEGEALEAALVGDALCVSCDDWTRLYGADGRVITEAGPGAVFASGVGGQYIVADGAWGEPCQRLIDPDGSPASGGFQRLLPLCAGRYAFMQMPGTEYYSEDLGGIATSWRYEKARWGIVDAAGGIILPARYLEIRAVGEDRLLLRDGDGAYLTDRDGNVIRAFEAEAPSAGAGA